MHSPQVEQHPQRDLIDQMIAAGFSVRKIAASVVPPIPFMSVQRYKTDTEKDSDTFPRKPVDTQPLIKRYSDTGPGSKVWVESELVAIVKATAKTDRGIARSALMDIARLNGHVAPTRTESVQIRVSGNQLTESLQRSLAALPAAVRAELDPAVMEAIDVESEPIKE